MAAYRGPFAPPRARSPLHVFPRHITASRDWLASLYRDLSGWQGSVAFIWPCNDIAFRQKELDRWRQLWPQATVEKIDRCGHFLWEDAPAQSIECLKRALGDFPAKAATP